MNRPKPCTLIVTDDGTPTGLCVGHRAGTEHWENGPGSGRRRVVRYVPVMASTSPPPALRVRDLECLQALRGAKAVRPEWKGWLTPMYVGGRDASHHSRTLARLVHRKLVERKERAGWTKTSWLYRITPAGRAALQEATR